MAEVSDAARVLARAPRRAAVSPVASNTLAEGLPVASVGWMQKGMQVFV